MRMIHHVQGSKEWLDWRVGGIGSSDAMVIAAAHGMVERKPWMRTLDDLYEEKMTGVSKVIENPLMARGKAGEAAARAAFERRMGIPVSPLCAEMDDNPAIRASFDGITFDQRDYVEIKVPNQSVHELAKNGEIVDYYMPQVAHQGITAWGDPDKWSADGTAFFATFVPETGDLAVVKRSASEIHRFARELYQYEVEFLQCLQNGVPPCGVEFASLARRYLGIEAEMKELEKIKQALRAGMIELAERKQVVTLDGLGVTLEERSKTGSVDYDKLFAEYSITPAEVAKYRKPDSKFWQVRVDLKRVDDEVKVAVVAAKSSPDINQVITVDADDSWGAFAPPASNRTRATTASMAA